MFKCSDHSRAVNIALKTTDGVITSSTATAVYHSDHCSLTTCIYSVDLLMTAVLN